MSGGLNGGLIELELELERRLQIERRLELVILLKTTRQRVDLVDLDYRLWILRLDQQLLLILRSYRFSSSRGRARFTSIAIRHHNLSS